MLGTLIVDLVDVSDIFNFFSGRGRSRGSLTGQEGGANRFLLKSHEGNVHQVNRFKGDSVVILRAKKGPFQGNLCSSRGREGEN